MGAQPTLQGPLGESQAPGHHHSSFLQAAAGLLFTIFALSIASLYFTVRAVGEIKQKQASWGQVTGGCLLELCMVAAERPGLKLARCPCPSYQRH